MENITLPTQRLCDLLGAEVAISVSWPCSGETVEAMRANADAENFPKTSKTRQVIPDNIKEKTYYRKILIPDVQYTYIHIIVFTLVVRSVASVIFYDFSTARQHTSTQQHHFALQRLEF